MKLNSILANIKRIKSKKIGKNLYLNFGGSSYVFDISEIKTVLPVESPDGWRVEICHGALCKTPETIIATESEAQAIRVSNVIYGEISKSFLSWLKWLLVAFVAITVLSIVPYGSNQPIDSAPLPFIPSQDEAFNPLTGMGQATLDRDSTAKKDK